MGSWMMTKGSIEGAQIVRSVTSEGRTMNVSIGAGLLPNRLLPWGVGEGEHELDLLLRECALLIGREGVPLGQPAALVEHRHAVLADSRNLNHSWTSNSFRSAASPNNRSRGHIARGAATLVSFIGRKQSENVLREHRLGALARFDRRPPVPHRWPSARRPERV